MSDPSNKDWQPWHMQPLERRLNTTFESLPPKAQQKRKDDAEQELLMRQISEAEQVKGYDDGHAEGFEAGYREGEIKARAEAEAELNSQTRARLDEVDQFIGSFKAATGQLEDELGRQMVELAIQAGRHLALRALALKPDHILDDIQQLMADYAGLNGSPIIRVSTDDLSLVEANLSQSIAASGWTLRADPALDKGDCRIDTDHGQIDAAGDDRWQRLLHAVGHGEH